jgi:hypothetical protein
MHRMPRASFDGRRTINGVPGLHVDKSERWINARGAQAWTGFGPRHSHDLGWTQPVSVM